ncbi:MAG: hypothetical protein E6I46_00310 [Chloroflexi bacterium]|nr:MAG: hypothetical protein E6I46_00310 [Chloroflexota bacterium]
MEKDRPSLAVRALVILAAVTAAAAATIPQASAAKPSTGTLGGPSTGSGRPQLATGVPCHVITANPLGVCPPPVIRPAIWQQPSLILCPTLARPRIGDRIEPRMSLCGSGFYPGDHIDVIVVGTYGSTFWPAEADRSGRFKSSLPSPLCRLTPATVFALDMHLRESPSIPLGGVRCP